MKITISISLLVSTFLLSSCSGKSQKAENENKSLKLNSVSEVIIADSFWTPRFELWRTVTATDVFDKFEGKFKENPEEWQQNNSFANFDDVAQGKKGTGHHAGLPWFDGLIYETIRGVSDLLAQKEDPSLEKRVDGYIDRIYAAQRADTNGYINTWTDLMEPEHRWGDNGGLLRFQHDVYNSGMLVEAGVHYYLATGKTKLLETATRLANYMARLMGPSPKRNIVPAHSGPEEALVKLYWLYKNNPELKSQIQAPINEQDYYNLAKFWVDNRGNHCGYPLWQIWGNEKSEQWIRAQMYKTDSISPNVRPSWGVYAQDSIPVFEQKSIEGHAVRATLLATGITTVALENRSGRYVETAKTLWNNMVGKRMFVTGGVGAVHYDEKFGPDYFLPVDAYLETCAAVGAGFFSQRMNELTADAKYMDEFERALYNNVLAGVSLSGTNYTYQNPLNSQKHTRWNWHDCPCCPPMFLKMVSAIPGYIYASQADNLYVNLFIGSRTAINLENVQVQISMKTGYPWNGKVIMNIDPDKEAAFTLRIRIPGWAQGKENPYSLYASDLKSQTELYVNNRKCVLDIENGYAVVDRIWKKGDKVELLLPIDPRIITANDEVKNLDGMVALASGPLIYSLESIDNGELDKLCLDKNSQLELNYQDDLLGGINTIRILEEGKPTSQTAIPYYALGNRGQAGYKVWIPVTEK